MSVWSFPNHLACFTKKPDGLRAIFPNHSPVPKNTIISVALLARDESTSMSPPKLLPHNIKGPSRLGASLLLHLHNGGISGNEELFLIHI